MAEVILVNAGDTAIGVMEKLEAHRIGKLHRAFSVLVYNTRGEMLLQKRAHTKYHSGGLWTNACCSHPLPHEKSETAAKKRLREELNLNADPAFLYKFIYKAQLDNNLTEYEYDHVFTCITDQRPLLNTGEVEDYKYIEVPELMKDMDNCPDKYTFWFRQIMDRIKF